MISSIVNLISKCSSTASSKLKLPNESHSLKLPISSPLESSGKVVAGKTSDNMPNKSFSVWVKNNGNTDSARIFNVGYAETNSTGFAIGIDDGTDNKPFYFLRDTSAGVLKAEFGDVLNTTDWYHFAISIDGTANEAYIYQNGDLKVTVSNVGEPAQTTNQTAKIGKHFASGQNHYFNGLIDEVAIWNTALTSTQIQSIYDAKGTNLTKDLTTVSGSNLKYWNRMGD